MGDTGVHAQVRTARSQWLAEEEGGIDDCTAIVCILQQGSRPRRTGSMLPVDAAKAATAVSRSAPALQASPASRQSSARAWFGSQDVMSLAQL